MLVLVAIFAPFFLGRAAEAADLAAIASGPSARHLLGTDDLGRDVAARTLVATGISLGLALVATTIGVVIGILLGAAPSVLGRRLGRLVTAAVNLAVAFPGLLLALFFAAIFGAGARGAVLALGLATAPSFARLTQTLTASVAGRDFVGAARVLGVGRLRLLTRHILPNIGEPLVVNATLGAAGALLAFASLSFIGLGVQPPSYDWGRLLAEGLNNIYVTPVAALGPGAAVLIAGLAINLLGETAAQSIGMRSTVRLPREPAFATGPGPGKQEGAHPLLVVSGLQVAFPRAGRWVYPVREVSFSMDAGDAVGLVGESGAGKSLTALAIARLLREPAVVSAERLEFDGRSLLTCPDAELRKLLGAGLAMVFQDPMSSFNPALRMGRQLAEVAEVHQGLDRRTALARAVDRLRAVHIPSPQHRARQFPHEFSGGMRQRAMIGVGLMGSPRLMIADEPTTALDVTVQPHILGLLARLRAESGSGLLIVSHDIALVSQVCDRVLVMYAGRIVEDLSVRQLLSAPRHPYTRALMNSVPDLSTDRDRPLVTIPGHPPEPGRLPPGCAFAPRCPRADDLCSQEDPPLTRFPSGDRAACWHPQHNPLCPDQVLDGAR